MSQPHYQKGITGRHFQRPDPGMFIKTSADSTMTHSLWGYSNWNRSRTWTQVRTNRGQPLPSNSRICPVSIRCLDSFRYLSVRILSGFPLSVYPAGQGRDRAVRTFTIIVGRRLCWSLIWGLISLTAGLFIYSITTSLRIVFEFLQ